MLTRADLRDAVPAVLRSTCGRTIALDVARWVDDVTPDETRVLEEAVGPVLDVGCGPGRMVAALHRRRIPALGIDIHRAAVKAARARGAAVRRADVFRRVPGEGRWATALLLDGNIGIGGDPVVLLARVRDIVRPAGLVLVEIEPPGTADARLIVRAEVDDELRSGWFPWAIVGVDELPRLASRAGFDLRHVWKGGERWFSSLAAR